MSNIATRRYWEERDRPPLKTPKGRFQEMVRRLAEEAMSVTHHDIDHAEPEAIHEIEAMELRFTNILRGYLSARSKARARSGGDNAG